MERCETGIYLGRYTGNAKNPKHKGEYFFKTYLDEQDASKELEGKTVRLVNAELHEEWKRRAGCIWYGREEMCLRQQGDTFGGDSGEGRCGSCINCQKCVHSKPPSISRMTMPYLRQLGYIEKYQMTDGKDGRRPWDNLLEKSTK